MRGNTFNSVEGHTCEPDPDMAPIPEDDVGWEDPEAEPEPDEDLGAGLSGRMGAANVLTGILNYRSQR